MAALGLVGWNPTLTNQFLRDRLRPLDHAAHENMTIKGKREYPFIGDFRMPQGENGYLTHLRCYVSKLSSDSLGLFYLDPRDRGLRPVWYIPSVDIRFWTGFMIPDVAGFEVCGLNPTMAESGSLSP